MASLQISRFQVALWLLVASFCFASCVVEGKTHNFKLPQTYDIQHFGLEIVKHEICYDGEFLQLQLVSTVEDCADLCIENTACQAYSLRPYNEEVACGLVDKTNDCQFILDNYGKDYIENLDKGDDCQGFGVGDGGDDGDDDDDDEDDDDDDEDDCSYYRLPNRSP